MIELLSTHECGVSGNSNEVPFCVSQKGEKGDMHEKPEKRDVVNDINPEGGHDDEKTADMSNVREDVHEKPEKRANIDSNLDFDLDSECDEAKYNVNNAVKTQLYEIDSKPMIKSLGEAVFENTLGKVSGKHRVHEKPGMRTVMDDIFDAVMLNMKYKAGIKAHQGRELIMHEKLQTRNGMIKTTPKAKYDVNNAVIKSLGEAAFEMRMLKTNPKYKNVNLDIIDAAMFNKKHEAGIQVNPKGKNNAVTPIEDPSTVQW
jgi:hypothetical protein